MHSNFMFKLFLDQVKVTYTADDQPVSEQRGWLNEATILETMSSWPHKATYISKNISMRTGVMRGGVSKAGRNRPKPGITALRGFTLQIE